MTVSRALIFSIHNLRVRLVGHASLSRPPRLFASVSIKLQEEVPHLIMHCFTNFIFRLMPLPLFESNFFILHVYCIRRNGRDWTGLDGQPLGRGGSRYVKLCDWSVCLFIKG